MLPRIMDQRNEANSTSKEKERKMKNTAHHKGIKRRQPSKSNNANILSSFTSPRSPGRNSRSILSSVYQSASGSGTPSSAGTNGSKLFHFHSKDVIPWHAEIEVAIKTNQWNSVRAFIQQLNHQNSINSMSLDSFDSLEKKGTKVSFWSRISGIRGIGNNSQSTTSSNSVNRTGLLTTDDDQCTPLHLILTNRKVPTDIVQGILTLEPRAVSMPNVRGRLPLHFAIVHRVDLSAIASLIDAYPSAISFPDSKGLSPLQYAVDIARRDSMKINSPPRTFWMPLPDFCLEAVWQEEQTERWSVVHWLLLSSATHVQTSLSVGGRKPILVEALLAAAPPPVISLLIGASVVLLSYEKKATAFAGSTLYACITRHYPLSILMSLASQCPADVYKVRDETGMGLVSAQFISGCFEQTSHNQEWSVSEDFYACFNECIEEGEIGDDPAISDWWRKIEFLISLCACSKMNRSAIKSGKSRHTGSVIRFEPSNFPKEYILHGALSHNDTPPPVLRMILSLYPESINLKDPKTDALPLHLICMKHEYVPRFYEVQVTGHELSINIVLEANPSAVGIRHDGRLPLHYAIASGRMISSFVSLLDATMSYFCNGNEYLSRPPLLQIDPITGLYPFLLAASYQNNSDVDSLRWTSTARNKYSNSRWNALSDREKASAILSIVELEDIARIETIYELLRRQPEAISSSPMQRKMVIDTKHKSETCKRDVLTRDASGIGIVAEHYISWCFTKKSYKNEVIYENNISHQNILRRSIQEFHLTGSLLSTPPEFCIWWAKLLKIIIRVFREDVRRNDTNEWSQIPCNKQDFVLHMALTNPDTPPEIIELLLASSPSAVALTVPGSDLLPLHIITQATPYTPRPFEQYKQSSISLILNANPGAARIAHCGRTSLLMAIASGQPFIDIERLLRANPAALTIRDPITGLFAFQLMASLQTFTASQRLYFQYKAKNKFSEKEWENFDPQIRTRQILLVQKEYDMEVLSATYMLLRSDVSSLQCSMNHNAEPQTIQVSMKKPLARNNTSLTLASKGSVVSGNFSKSSDDSSFLAKAKVPLSPGAKEKKTLPLVLLLSQHRMKATNHGVDMYECDTSVLSNIDVLSTLTSTMHTGKNSKSRSREDDDSIEFEGFNRDKDSSIGETSYDDFAEDSFVRSSATYSEGDNSAIQEESGNFNESIDSAVLSEEGSYSIFEIRRSPRALIRKVNDEFDGSGSPIKLVKRPAQVLLADIKPYSQLKLGSPKSKSECFSTSQQSTPLNIGSGYIASRSDEICTIGIPSKETVSNSLKVSSTTTGTFSECSTDAEHSSVSLSLPSSHQRFQPNAPLSALPSTTSKSSDSNKHYNGSKNKKNATSFGKDARSALLTNHSSLLGAYSDLDTEDDDPLLNLGPQPFVGTYRSASDHFNASTNGKNRFTRDRKKESSDRFGRSNSEHITKAKPPTMEQLLLGNDQKTEERLHQEDSSKNAAKLKSVNLSGSSGLTSIAKPIFPSSEEKEASQEYSTMPDARNESKYFDKQTMTWRERLPPTEVGAISKQNKTFISPQKIMYFDKILFNWVAKPVEAKHPCQSTPSENVNKNVIPQQQNIQNPFTLDMSKSKKTQISKSERHHAVTDKNRSQFIGSSPMNRPSRSSIKNDQFTVAMTSSRNLFTCIVCRENERNVLLVPCRHLCLCQTCSIAQNNVAFCPLCSCQVTEVMVIA